MAVSLVGAGGFSAAVKTTASPTLNLSGTVTAQAGDDLFWWTAADPQSGSPSISHSGTATLGTTTTEATMDESGSADGSGNVYLMRTPITADGTVTGVSITYATSVAAKAAGGLIFRGVGSRTDAFTNGSNSSTASAASNNAFAAGSFVLAAFGVEGVLGDFFGDPGTGSGFDAPTTFGVVASSGGGAASNQGVVGAYILSQSADIPAFSSAGLVQSLNSARSSGTLVAVYDPASTGSHFDGAASDSVSVSDSAARSAQSLSRGPSASVTVSDAASANIVTARTASASVAVSDAATGALGKNRDGADSISVSDAVARDAQALARTPSESVGVSDGTSRTVVTARAVSESASVSDSVASSLGKSRSASDSLSVSDAAARDAQALTRTAGDSVSVGPGASRVVGTGRTATGSVSVSDAASRQLAASRTASGSVSFSDAAGRSAQALTRAAGDSVTIGGDTADGTGGAIVTATDSFSVSDATTRGALAFNRTASESVSLSDTASQSGGGESTASDSVTVSDAAGRLAAFGRSAADNWTVSGVAARLVVLGRTASDGWAVSDAASGTVHSSAVATTPVVTPRTPVALHTHLPHAARGRGGAAPSGRPGRPV